ncbi:hypothetical protein KHQ81_09905 [Mycoplasmatota bacterium]|nr:hypothetical protein KHQ81_09905 [Mycoplasmatota bacterium]
MDGLGISTTSLAGVISKNTRAPVTGLPSQVSVVGKFKVKVGFLQVMHSTVVVMLFVMILPSIITVPVIITDVGGVCGGMIRVIENTPFISVTGVGLEKRIMLELLDKLTVIPVNPSPAQVTFPDSSTVQLIVPGLLIEIVGVHGKQQDTEIM